ncbi:MAG: hypothetical protein NZ992_02340 [Candidatus Korarchaeum sp.]|nr:hypothetical protein [Candidatus Korarchaeum sp.]MDW8036365.1 hypothetical protein [Candidatus Korarchaeum sp.]
MRWERRKEVALERLRDHLEKRRIDPDIVSLLEAINSLPFAYTTSSCSGRVQLYEAELPGEKFSMRSLRKWHFGVEEEELLRFMRGENVWLAVLPPIIHVYTCSLRASIRMLKLLRESGFKRAGILHLSEEGGFLEAVGTERLELPLRLKGRDLLDAESIRLIVEVANSMLRKAKVRLSRLEVRVKHEASGGLGDLCRERAPQRKDSQH